MFDDAVARASAIRSVRRAVIERCAAGIGPGELRRELIAAQAAGDPDGLGTLRLLPALEAMPAIGGKVASRRLLAGAGLVEDVTLAEVGDSAWEHLASASGPAAADADDTVTP